MSLILATGSNISGPLKNLELAKKEISSLFDFIAQSRIYTSKAVEYTNQPDFYNQLLEFKTPNIKPKDAMKLLLNIEEKLGRKRDIAKGPRTIDIDIIFWDLESIQETNLTIPHPSWADRSFVTLPLQELPYFQTLKKSFIIPTNFNNTALPIS